MSEPFDPYREWLGIANGHRPPNHYQLLGLQPFEADLERIENSSMILMALVLEHDPGPQRQWAQRLFDELSEAKEILSDPQRKAAYDSLLQDNEGELLCYLSDSSGGPQAGETHKALSPELLYGPLHSATDTAEAPRRRQAEENPTDERPREKPEPRFSLSFGNLDRRWVALGAAVVLLASLAWNVSYLPIGRAPPNPVPSLVAQLKSPEAKTRLAAAKKLAGLGPRASDAVPQLVEVLKHDQDDLVRLAAADALVGAGGGLEAVQQELEEILKDETNPTIRVILKSLTNAEK